jgi:hypothetical protein
MCTSRIGVLFLVLAAACSGGEMPDMDAGDGSADASSDAQMDAMADAAPDAPTCTCAGVSTCCDGCLPRNVGADCVDALVCTTSACNIAGVCVSTGVPVSCPAPAEPECQASACSSPGGCATSSIREGMSCSDDNAQTYDDHCASGACVGTACECASGPCCDGCHFRANTYQCVTNGPVSATCTNTSTYGGACVGTSRVNVQYGNRFCTGAASACTGTIDVPPGSMTVNSPCEPAGPDWNMPNVCRTDAGDPLGARCDYWCE